jgi:hypothetical protein
MQKSFRQASLQLLEEDPNEVAKKFPELIKWKDSLNPELKDLD